MKYGHSKNENIEKNARRNKANIKRGFVELPDAL